jgi:transposase
MTIRAGEEVGMRGADNEQPSMFSYISAERRVPKDHPLRAIRAMADTALKALDQRFAAMYAALGRPSIAPERLLRALLLQVLYTVRSERLLMEQLDYNFLFRWFVGLSIDDSVWDVTVFTKNRDRLLKGEVAEAFFHRGAGAGPPAGNAVRRALHGRRHPDRSVGRAEEFQAQRWQRGKDRAARR